jgi:hypothetical protein
MKKDLMDCDTTELCKELFTQILRELNINVNINNNNNQNHQSSSGHNNNNHHNHNHNHHHHENIKTEIIKKPFRWG